MTGTIRCNKCKKKMDGVCECGNYKCFVSIYWHGEYLNFRKDDQGYVFTYDKAKDKLIEINHAIKKGEFNPEDCSDEKVAERKFENMIEKWLNQKEQEVNSNELSPETLRPYRSYSRNYYSFFNGYDVREIDFELLEHFKDHLPNALSLKMKRNILSALHVFFVWLRRKGTIKVFPVWPEIKGNDSKPMVALDLEEQMEALKRIPVEHRDIYSFLMETGLRQGEACALKVKDIDMKNGNALIRRTWRGPKLAETTKGKNKRWIPLSDTAFEIAKRNIEGKLSETFLFINPVTGRGYKQECLRKRWRRHSGFDVTLKEATRHSFCTQIAEGGMCNTLQAQELMRHSDLRSTQKYFHGSIEKMKGIVNNRGKVIPMNKTMKIEMG
ncbi:MAG: tyrosine-type recombinase/integrase [Syntrophorhabdaceae bacterium]|nr:tyrosine-type recombinase/integrase [Syntrophorhabdaceae bacterium]